jgi:hypothetical protein
VGLTRKRLQPEFFKADLEELKIPAEYIEDASKVVYGDRYLAVPPFAREGIILMYVMVQPRGPREGRSGK